MDLFHTITQEIENVLSCHWLQEFRESKFGSNTNTNSTNTPSASRSVSRSASVAPTPLRRSSAASSSSTSPILSRSGSISEAEAAKMSSGTGGLMDTAPGGESTQYESIQTVTKPHSKEEGQLGGGLPSTTTDTSGVDADRAEKTTDNIRYGQNISESGMGGKTTTSSGEANNEGGYGGTKAQEDLESSGNSRAEQQYSAKDGVHDHNVGA